MMKTLVLALAMAVSGCNIAFTKGPESAGAHCTKSRRWVYADTAISVLSLMGLVNAVEKAYDAGWRHPPESHRDWDTFTGDDGSWDSVALMSWLYATSIISIVAGERMIKRCKVANIEEVKGGEAASRKAGIHSEATSINTHDPDLLTER